MKKFLSILFTVAFIITISANAVLATDSLIIAPMETYDLITYDYETKTETIIPANSITSYSDLYQTTSGFRYGTDTVVLQTMSQSTILALTDEEDPYRNIPDNRFLSPPTVAPNTGVICFAVDFINDEGKTVTSLGTGFLVAPDVIVTCAHLIILDPDYELLRVKAYSQIHQDNLDGEDYVYPQSWTYSEAYMDESGTVNTQYDLCILKMQSNLSGYNFDCTYVTPSVGTEVLISGYPGDHPFYQYSTYANVYELPDPGMRIHHTGYCVAGMSGSPIYLSSSMHCVGIHTSGAYDGGVFMGGVLITRAVYDTICYVIEK